MNLHQAEKLLGVPLESLGAAIEKIEDQSYIELRDKGVSCVSKDNRTITAIQLHNFGHEGYSRYTGNLPGNLLLSMGRTETRALLGKPQRSGEETNVPVLGRKPPWDVFKIGSIQVHVEYLSGCKAIGMVTLSGLAK